MKVRLKTYVIATVLGVLVVSSPAQEQNNKETGKAESENQKTVKSKAEREKDIKGWALGCSAVLIERNADKHDTLNPFEMNEKNIKGCKEITLGRWWGVKNRKDLLDALKWIDIGGHRSRFEGLGKVIQDLDDEKYQELLKRYKDKPETLQKIQIAKEYYQKLGEKSILGWDYIRYICLCRWGYAVGYISEEEAWEKIIPVAKMLQKTFDSWEDLGRNYLIGRQFWSYEYTKKEGYLFEESVQRLLDMPLSPWNKYPWNMDLGGVQTISDANAVKKAR
jgi:hypothetical protein